MFFMKTAPICAAAAAISMTISTPVFAQDSDTMTVELNKFEDNGSGGCRAFFLFRNQTQFSFQGFEMSFAILDTGGIIDRLLTIDAAPIPVARTTLKLFEIPDISCAAISQVLLHEMPSCRPQNAEEMDCFPLLSLLSRTSAELVK